jgi:hypothetical protein
VWIIEKDEWNMLLAFMHIEKAAGITVEIILRRNFGNRHCDIQPWWQPNKIFTAADYRKLRLLYPRLLSIAGHKIRPCSDLYEVRPDVRYFTTMRDPIERCVSHYQFQIQNLKYHTQPFEEWIEERQHHNFVTKKIADADDVDEAIRILNEQFIFVGLLKRFDESMVMLRRLLKPWPLDIRYTPKNVVRRHDIKRRILDDENLRRRVEQVNELDLQVYRYVVEKLYPRQQAEYGPGLEDEVEQFRATNREPRFSLPLIMNRARRNLLYKPALAIYRVFHRH